MAVNPSWTSGARSVTPLVGDGWFSFSVPVGSAGVFVGVVGDDTSTLPDEPILGFMFGSGEYRVDEKGLEKTSAVPYSEGQVFSIGMYKGLMRVYFHVTATVVIGVNKFFGYHVGAIRRIMARTYF